MIRVFLYSGTKGFDVGFSTFHKIDVDYRVHKMNITNICKNYSMSHICGTTKVATSYNNFFQLQRKILNFMSLCSLLFDPVLLSCVYKAEAKTTHMARKALFNSSQYDCINIEDEKQVYDFLILPIERTEDFIFCICISWSILCCKDLMLAVGSFCYMVLCCAW